MLTKQNRDFLAAFLGLPDSRIDLFAARLDGLRKANFPETGTILDIIHQLTNLPPDLKQEILNVKRQGLTRQIRQPRHQHWA